MSESTSDFDWMTEHELAQLLGFPVDRVRRWRSAGYGPRYLKLGGAVRYRRSEVLRWLAAVEVDTPRKRATT